MALVGAMLRSSDRVARVERRLPSLSPVARMARGQGAAAARSWCPASMPRWAWVEADRQGPRWGPVAQHRTRAAPTRPSVSTGAAAGADAASDSGSDARAYTEELIDDMEDGNGFIPAVDGRRGTWSVANDGTAGSEQIPSNPFFMTLIPNGRGKSAYAAHSAGHGFTGWGAVTLVTLNQLSNDPKQPYDASDCVGLTFWAKVGPAAATSYKIRIANADTLPEGKVCSGMTCNDHHEIVAMWSTTWTKYTYLFADMRQEGWGVPQKPFDTTKIYDVEFQTSGSDPFDFSIDNLAFLKK